MISSPSHGGPLKCTEEKLLTDNWGVHMADLRTEITGQGQDPR